MDDNILGVFWLPVCGASGEPSEGRDPAGNMENLLGSCLSGQKVSEKADRMAPARLWGCQEAVSQQHTMVHLHILRARRNLAAAPTFHRRAWERPWRCCSNHANRAYRSRGLGGLEKTWRAQMVQAPYRLVTGLDSLGLPFTRVMSHCLQARCPQILSLKTIRTAVPRP